MASSAAAGGSALAIGPVMSLIILMSTAVQQRMHSPMIVHAHTLVSIQFKQLNNSIINIQS